MRHAARKYKKIFLRTEKQAKLYMRACAKMQQRQLADALASATLGDLALGDAAPACPARAVDVAARAACGQGGMGTIRACKQLGSCTSGRRARGGIWEGNGQRRHL